MRVALSVLLTVLLSSSSWAFEESIAEKRVARAIQRAEQWYDALMLNATINGAQSSRRSTKTTPESLAMDRAYHVYEKALETLTTRHNMSPIVANQYLRQSTTSTCNQNVGFNCNVNLRYRTSDGTCNNLQNPRWGASGTAQNRFFAPAYADGRSTPRGGFTNSPTAGNGLPNARFVSMNAHPDFNISFPSITNMVPQYGQFLDHDLSITPEANKQCCSSNNQADPNCWSIPIVNDQFFTPKGQRCMDFTRSTPCNNPSNGNREQTNMNTAYIDASQVYGSGATRTNQLRSFQGGRMLTNNQGLNGFLPQSKQTSTLSSNNVQGNFIAGDDRINEMPGLAVMHNVFLMEHNRIADQFRNARPSWSDEQIFQETRRIVGALLQQVTYNEYLPAILGPDAMSKYNLFLPSPGQFSSYSSNVDATIYNEFSTAAYRFGHTLVNGIVRLLDEFNHNVQQGAFDIKDQYFQSDQITASNGRGFDWILKGLMETNSQMFDPFVTTGMTNFLFAQRGAAFGSDLVARNIQRGRDHGLSPYTAYRRQCSSIPFTYNGAPSDMDPSMYNVLRQTYPNGPDTVDLFSGSLHERPVPGGVSGVTFNCIKGEQFNRLKWGDRYFFTHSNGAYPFTSPQLQILRTQRLGDIICRNSRQAYTQNNVFRIPDGNNQRISCTDASRSFSINPFLF